MFNLRKENEPVKQGFNFYHLSDPHNFGGMFRWGNVAYQCRYSKSAKRWFFRKLVTSRVVL